MNNRSTFLLYGGVGKGKSVSIASFGKISTLKIRVLATENNAIQGIRDGLQIYGITPKPEQFVVCNPRPAQQQARQLFNAVVKDQPVPGEGDPMYNAIMEGIVNFKGIDLATNEIVDCKSPFDWGLDTIFVIDGLSSIQDSLIRKASKELSMEAKSGKVDGKALVGRVQGKLLPMIGVLADASPCHFALLAHHKKTFDAVTENIEHVTINLVGQAATDSFMGKFAYVLYADTANIQGKKSYVWNIAKNNVDATARSLYINNPNLKFDKLTPDFSLEEYGFFS